MRLWLSVLLAAALLAAGAASAFAVPSLAGPTGLVMCPTADIAPAGMWQVAAGNRSMRINMYQESFDISDWSINALKGVADDAEVFVTYQRVTDGKNTDVWEYGGKYLIGEDLFPRQGFLGGTKVAVGGSLSRWADALGIYDDMVSEVSTTDVKTVRAYLVATKQLAPTYTGEWPWEAPSGTRIVATVGLMYFRVDPDRGEANSVLRPFLGVEVTGQRQLTLLAEYRLKDSSVESHGEFAFAIRKPFGSSTTVEVGLSNANPIGLGIDEQNLFARMTYAFPTEAYQ